MKNVILVVDIGNTSTAIGFYRNRKITNEFRIATAKTNVPLLQKKLKQTLGRSDLGGVCISSVVPKVNTAWRSFLKVSCKKIIWVNRTLNLGIPITYPKQKTIGADRLANACWVASQYKGPSIVADFGTALTFDVVIPKQGYIGGIIAPGLPLMFNYLSERTALLPYLKPTHVKGHVGKSTEEAMMLGAQWGYRGMVREIFKELVRNLKLKKVKFYATGGDAKWVAHGSNIDMIVDPHLTLRGLGRLFELNNL